MCLEEDINQTAGKQCNNAIDAGCRVGVSLAGSKPFLSCHRLRLRLLFSFSFFFLFFFPSFLASRADGKSVYVERHSVAWFCPYLEEAEYLCVSRPVFDRVSGLA